MNEYGLFSSKRYSITSVSPDCTCELSFNPTINNDLNLNAHRKIKHIITRGEVVYKTEENSHFIFSSRQECKQKSSLITVEKTRSMLQKMRRKFDALELELPKDVAQFHQFIPILNYRH